MEERNQNTETRTLILARDPALLYKIKQDLDKRIIGEDRNKLLLFLIGASSLTNRPLGAIITGDSSSGKSYVMNQTLKYFSNVEKFTRITKASPDRLAKDFSNKILVVEELHGSEAAQSTIRVWISEGKLSLLTTERDEEGKITTQVIETKGSPVFITTHAGTFAEEQLLNRIMIISVDETKEQTRKILEFEAEEFMKPHSGEYIKPDPAIARFLKGLIPFDVKIPYADLLAKTFPADSVKSRRDFKKLLCLIGTHAFIYQKQRPWGQDPKKKTEGGTFIMALPCDFYAVWEIAADSMRDTLFNLQRRFFKILDLFSVGMFHTAKSAATKSGYSQSRARQILNVLVDRGILLVDETNKPYQFFLREKPEITSINGLEHELNTFDEESLKTYLEGCCSNATYMLEDDEGEEIKYVAPKELNFSFPVPINPLTGEPFSTSIALEQHQPKPVPNASNETKPKPTSKTLIEYGETVNREALIATIKENFHVGTKDAFKQVAKEKGGLSGGEAETLFTNLVEEGLLVVLPLGLWTWVK